MRRLVFACALVALALPAGALGLTRATGDGTLSVKNSDGVINIAARGGVIGSCDACTIFFVDPEPNDGSGPIVTGFEAKNAITETKRKWEGTNVRFRLIGGFFRLRVLGTGIDLSAVGQGSVTLRGYPFNLGTYSLNGADRRLLPEEARTFQLREPALGG
jgi:hypothetical protein